MEDPWVGGGRRLNNAGFDAATPAAAKRQGTLSRNSLRGFPASQLDLAVHRRFNLGRGLNLVVRAEVFNVLNHPNFGDPGANSNGTNQLNTAIFGQSTQM